MTIGKLSGQCDFGQKGQSYCNQRGQSCVAKRVKVAWLFHYDSKTMFFDFQRKGNRFVAELVSVYDPLLRSIRLVSKHLHPEGEFTGLEAEIWDEPVE